MMANFEELKEVVLQLFKISNFTEEQEMAIKGVLAGKDVFVSLPTGSGKSLIYQTIPFFHGSHLRDTIKTDKCVLVISPLISLMEDQLKSLQELGISTISLSKDVESDIDTEGITEGLYSLIYTSPEAALEKYRNLIRSIGDMIVAVAIDESHCIKKWGASNGEVVAFRDMYGNLAELRSFLSSQTPVIALTATATQDTLDCIQSSLLMYNPLEVINLPEKSNIKYSLVTVKHNNVGIIFKEITESLIKDGRDMERFVIFCRRLEDMRTLYQHFHHLVGEGYNDFKDRPYAMYHAQTSQEIKDFILTSFKNPSGSVRVLVATIAFGMGVDCKGLHHVIHYGPPASIEDYFQETGRAGRDGQQSHAILIKYPGSTRSKNVLKGMKEYLSNESTCRRILLLQVFGVKSDSKVLKHNCCDLCSQHCDCGSCDASKYSTTFFSHLTQTEKEDGKDENVVIGLSDEGITKLKASLLELREKCVESIKSNSLYCSIDMLTGFPKNAVEEIVSLANSNISESVLDGNTSLLNKNLFNDIICLVKECLLLYPANLNTSNISKENSSGESSESESSSEEYDSENDFNDYHCRTNASSDSE